MGKTSETKFFRNLDEYSARASERRNRIEIGEKVFTLESLIHEVNEIEVSILLNNFLSIVNIIVSINGDRNYLSHFLEVLKYNTDYQEIRDQVTNLVVEKIQSNEPEELESSVVISLVHFGYPAGRPDLIDQYEFSVNKSENNKTYSMETLFPLIKSWKNQEFNDPVVAKAFKHLLREYANELKAI